MQARKALGYAAAADRAIHVHCLCKHQAASQPGVLGQEGPLVSVPVWWADNKFVCSLPVEARESVRMLLSFASCWHSAWTTAASQRHLSSALDLSLFWGGGEVSG